MFSRTTRQRFYVLVAVILLLTSLWPSATPAYAGPPPEDVRFPDVADAGQGGDSLPLGGQGIAAPQQWGCYSGCTQYYDNFLWDVGDPISANSGAYHFDFPLLSLGGPMNLGFTLYYRSDFSQLLWYEYQAGLPERFWWSPLEHLEYSHDDPILGVYATVQIHNGNSLSFKQEGGQWVPTENGDFGREDNVSPVRWLLQETTDYFYLMDPIEERMHIFQKVGEWEARIARIVDRNGNQITYSYGGADVLYPTRVEDGLGRSLDLTYQDVGGNPALVRVTDQAGRQITFAHEAAGADNRNVWTLRSVSDPLGHTTTFRYQTLPGWTDLYHLIVQVERPLGNVPYRQTYDQVTFNGEVIPAVVAQQDAYGNTTTLAYDPAAYRTTETRQDGSTVVYEHHSYHGLPKSFTDAAGKTIQFSRDEATNRVTGLTDRLDDATQMAYHPQTGKIASFADAEGHTTAFTYTDREQTFTNPANGEEVSFTFYDLTRVSFTDGSYLEFSYDDQGNIRSVRNREGKIWSLTHNVKGQVLTTTNPTGGTITYTYNADGTLATRCDPETGTTTYGYNAFRRPNRITHEDGSFASITYDDNDHIVEISGERGSTYLFSYDENGNLAQVTDSKGRSANYTYDLMDRLICITDRRGKNFTFEYDDSNRVASYTDPNGVRISYGYDPRGWRDRISVGDGTWQWVYDEEGVPQTRTTPLGNVTQYQTNEMGAITSITDPLVNKTEFDRDPFQLITTITDPLGHTTAFVYNGWNTLDSVTRTGIGTASYDRNDLGRVTRITDLNGNNWIFGYSALGRLTSYADPLGNSWTHTHNNRGWMHKTTFPDGEMLTRTYDASGNVLERSYSGGLAITYTYDEDINRLLTADGLGFTYDEVGNVMATTNQGGVIFGATHDDGGRLASLTYADGAFTVSYTYDPVTGLLNQVRDDLTGTEIGFTYDADRRLVGITRPNGVNSIHSWDNANRLVRVQHGSYADLQYTFDGAGQVTQVQMSVPLDPGAVLTAGSRSFTYDDASQVSSPGYQYDARGRRTADLDHTYAWDSAGRLTQLNGVTFTYDGLNDPISRTEGNDTTTFYYNYAVSLHPIMAERRGMEGEWLHYYVYTPEGRLLYMIAAQDSNGRFFYHFDRSGNTLFLTDETGGVTDAYAYTPYGELFAHDGSNPQPFTFQGEWGVRMEESTLFDMRARYYDARTASFLTRDPIWPVLEGPRALNPYQYGFQNPMRYSDVTGLYPSRPSPDDQYEEMIRTILENAEDLLDDFIPSSETNGTDNGDDGDDGGFWSLADQILERDARLGRISLEVTTSSAFGDSFWHLATGSIVEEVLVNGSYQPLGSGERFGVMATDPESLALIERERAFQGIPADPTLGGTHYSVIVGGDQDRVVVSIRDNFTGSIIGSNQITIDSLSAGSPQLPDGTHRSYERNEVLDAFGRATADLVRGLLR